MVENTYELVGEKKTLQKHVTQTFLWMFLGLLVTFVTSVVVVETDLVYYAMINSWVPMAMLAVKLVLVMCLVGNLHKMKVGTARILFLTYSVTTGIVFSTLVFVYDIGSMTTVFGMTCLFFGIMAVAGLVTKRDITSFGPLVSISLITMIALSVVGLFIGSQPFEMAVSFLGLALFLCITTYDTKKMKDLYYANEGNDEVLNKLAIYSALELYLDFVNIFLYLLRILGRKRN